MRRNISTRDYIANFVIARILKAAEDIYVSVSERADFKQYIKAPCLIFFHQSLCSRNSPPYLVPLGQPGSIPQPLCTSPGNTSRYRKVAQETIHAKDLCKQDRTKCSQGQDLN